MKRSRLSRISYAFSKSRLRTLNDPLIESLPENVGDWKKCVFHDDYLHRARTVYENKKIGAIMRIDPPDRLWNAYTFRVSIMGGNYQAIGDGVWKHTENNLLTQLKSSLKMANIWHKNEIKTLKFVGAPTKLLQEVILESSKGMV